MSSSNCCFLTCVQISQEAGQVVWYSHLFKSFPQFVVIHTVKDFGVVNKAEVDVFLELSCFFDDPTDVGNLISGSSAFSKSSSNILKFTVHILLKPGLENFEHDFGVDHNKLWKILREMGIPGHLTWLLRNLYAGQEATVRTGHGTMVWFQIGKVVCQGCMLSPCLFNLYAEYIMRNAGLDKAQAGNKIARRNINKLRYADNTTLMAESEEELKSLSMEVKKECEKAGLKLNNQ